MAKMQPWRSCPNEKSLKLLLPDVKVLRLKCTKFDFCWGSTPDPARGAYSAPPEPLAGFKWSYFQGEGREGER